MRKLYFLVIGILVMLNTWSQSKTWNGGNGDWNDKTKWSPVGVPSSDDFIEFNGVSGTVTNVPAGSCRGIIIVDADIILAGGPSGAARELIVGTEDAAPSISLQVGATLTIGNNLDLTLAHNAYAAIEGTLVISANSTYDTKGGDATRTVVNGIIRNNGGQVAGEPSMLYFVEGSQYQHARDGGVIPTATWAPSAICSIEGVTHTAPTGLDQSFGSYTWDCQQQQGNINGVAIPGYIGGELSINQTGPATAPSAINLPAEITIERNLVINGGVLQVSNGNSVVTLNGNLVMNGGALQSVAGTIDIRFDGNTSHAITQSAGRFIRKDGTSAKGEIKLTVIDQSIMDMQDAVLTGDASFYVAAGATLMTGHAQGISLTGATGSVQVTGNRGFSSDAVYVYNGVDRQVTGNGLPAVVRVLQIDNQSGIQPEMGVVLSRPTAISGELVLSNGFLQTSAANMLAILDGATARSENDAFVSGPLQKSGKSDFTFPTGWAGSGGGMIPISIASMNQAAIVQAEYKRAPATNKGNTINAPLDHISYCEYWELFPISGSPKAVVTMFRNSHSNCAPMSSVLDFFTFRVARSNGASWSEIGNADGSMAAGSGYVVSDSAGVTINKTDRYFTLGNISSARDPLPVFFDNVAAYKKGEDVNVEWSNLTERDMATYFVERSVNGRDYSIIGQYIPKSNKDDKASYLYVDADPFPGANYYRIKAIEKNTKIIFSRIMRVETDVPEKHFNIYPNPLRGSQMTLTLGGISEGSYKLAITNAMGQQLYQRDIEAQGSFFSQSIAIPGHIKAGIYNISLTGNNQQFGKIFIVQ